MPKRLPDFDRMWAAFPRGTVDDVKALIGGGVSYDWIVNTCTIRLSRCFNYAGHPIPGTDPELNTVAGGDGLRYAFRVREFRRYLTRVYGYAGITHEYEQVGSGDVPPAFVGRKGVIAFDVDNWSDATGHFDLWDGQQCAGHAYFELASKVWLWEAPVAGDVAIGASVGRGGVNRPEDVATVQTLLARHGIDPGPVDGRMGPATLAAIRSFQRRFFQRPDGRIDVGGYTWSRLVEN